MVKSNKRIIPFWKRPLYTIILLGGLVAVSESALRLAHKFFKQNQEISIERIEGFSMYTFNPSIPNVNYSLRPNSSSKDGNININEYGFRGKAFAIEKDDNVLRIMLRGGSTVFEYEVTNDSKTTASQLESILQKTVSANIKIQVINAGISGYNAQQDFHTAKVDIPKFKPNMVCTFYGLNDTSAAYFDPSVYDFKEYSHFYTDPKLKRDKLAIEKGLDSIFLKTDKNILVWTTKWGTKQTDEETMKKNGRKGLGFQLERLAKLYSDNKCEVVWCTSTTQSRDAPDEWFNCVVRESQEKYGGSLFDWAREQKWVPRLFVDDCHFKDEIALKRAQRLAEVIMQTDSYKNIVEKYASNNN